MDLDFGVLCCEFLVLIPSTGSLPSGIFTMGKWILVGKIKITCKSIDLGVHPVDQRLKATIPQILKESQDSSFLLQRLCLS